MKKIYTLLLMVIAFPMSTMAQESIDHLFPAVHFTLDGVEYYLPAWDALTADGMRVQNTGVKTDPNDPGVGDDGETTEEEDPENPFNENNPSFPGDDDIVINGAKVPAKSRSLRYQMNGIIVSGSGIPVDLTCTSGNMGKAYWWFVSNPSKTITTANNPDNSIVKVKNGVVISNPRTATYSDVLDMDETLMNPIYKTVPLFQQTQIPENNYTNHVQLENYTIPSTAEPLDEDNISHASKFNITDLGEMAYYNKGMDWQFDNLICAKKITIPNHIKSLGKRCFQSNGLLLEVVFEEGSEITEIPNGCFHACKRLREVNIPATVTEIGDHAFAAINLWKIKFEGDNAPSMTLDAFKKFEAGTTAPDCKTNNCVISVKNEDAIVAFRQQNNIFKEMNFCIPVEINAYNMKSYCGAGLFVNQKILTKGVDDETNASSSVPNTWELADGEESNSLTGGLKLFYVNKATGIKEIDANGNKTITLQRVRSKVAGPRFGLILAGDEGIHDLFFPKESVTDSLDSPYNQLLMGTTTPTDMTTVMNETNNKNNTIFILKNGQFRRCSGGTMAARKSYLRLPNDLFDDVKTAKVFDIVVGTEDGDTDGVQSIALAQGESKDAWYTLQGVRVEIPSRGVFIRGGKKYVFE